MTAKLVLVVDNIEEQRDIAATLLRHHGYRVVEAGGGTEAMRLAREQKPDAILLDLMMSAPDGWEAARELKDDPDTAGIPIIALSVSYTTEDQERAREAGVDGYLIKPCLPTDVLKEVRRFLEPAAGAAE